MLAPFLYSLALISPILPAACLEKHAKPRGPPQISVHSVREKPTGLSTAWLSIQDVPADSHHLFFNEKGPGSFQLIVTDANGYGEIATGGYSGPDEKWRDGRAEFQLHCTVSQREGQRVWYRWVVFKM